MGELDAQPIPRLPARPAGGHKGTFGAVAIVGGSSGGHARMVGAPALAARAALRAGCGLARIVAPGDVLDAALVVEPSATGVALPAGDGVAPSAAVELLDRVLVECDCLAIGPGLGTSPAARALVLRAVGQAERPVVVDADGLNCMSEVSELNREVRGRVVLTPHPGEFGRLAANLRMEADATDEAQRPGAAGELARRLGCVVVLKGRGTVVSDGYRTWRCERGHAALATAGTGDVLTGLLASIIAQAVGEPPMPGLSEAMRSRLPRDDLRPLDLYDAARLAVEGHAIAGERWAERRGAAAGLLARELADELPGALEAMRGR